MDIKLRAGTAADAEVCGKICYEAFTTIAKAHNFTPDFPSDEIAIGLMKSLLSHPGFYSVVAELDGRIVIEFKRTRTEADASRLQKELGRDTDASFRRGSNLFELTRGGGERKCDGDSGSDKEMSHPRRTLTGNCVFNNHRTSVNGCYR
jgi:hypothetical protein